MKGASLVCSGLDGPQMQEERNALPSMRGRIAPGMEIRRLHFPDCLDEQAAGLERPAISLQRPMLAWPTSNCTIVGEASAEF